MAVVGRVGTGRAEDDSVEESRKRASMRKKAVALDMVLMFIKRCTE